MLEQALRKKQREDVVDPRISTEEISRRKTTYRDMSKRTIIIQLHFGVVDLYESKKIAIAPFWIKNNEIIQIPKGNQYPGDENMTLTLFDNSLINDAFHEQDVRYKKILAYLRKRYTFGKIQPNKFKTHPVCTRRWFKGVGFNSEKKLINWYRSLKLSVDNIQ